MNRGSIMSEDNYKAFIGKGFILLSIVLTLVVWGFLTYMLTPFTFTLDPFWMYFWSGFTALPIAGTFYVATHMFWLVAVENKRAKSAI